MRPALRPRRRTRVRRPRAPPGPGARRSARRSTRPGHPGRGRAPRPAAARTPVSSPAATVPYVVAVAQGELTESYGDRGDEQTRTQHEQDEAARGRSRGAEADVWTAACSAAPERLHEARGAGAPPRLVDQRGEHPPVRTGRVRRRRGRLRHPRRHHLVPRRPIVRRRSGPRDLSHPRGRTDAGVDGGHGRPRARAVGTCPPRTGERS